MLHKDTVESLARGLVEIIDEINAFYRDPANEAAYQAWLAERRLKGGENHPIQASEG